MTARGRTARAAVTAVALLTLVAVAISWWARRNAPSEAWAGAYAGSAAMAR